MTIPTTRKIAGANEKEVQGFVIEEKVLALRSGPTKLFGVI
jgi:hypothetical protein